jgi:hypothetical protein
MENPINKDENPLHDWVVLFKDPDAKGDYQKKSFEYEQAAIEFALIHSGGQPEKIFRVGRLDHVAGVINIKIEYQDGEDLELKQVIEEFCQIANYVRKESFLTMLIGLPFLDASSKIQTLRGLRDDVARRVCRKLKNNKFYYYDD